MTSSTDFDRLITSWLETAGPADIDREAVDAALWTARQRQQRRGLVAWLVGTFYAGGQLLRRGDLGTALPSGSWVAPKPDNLGFGLPSGDTTLTLRVATVSRDETASVRSSGFALDRVAFESSVTPAGDHEVRFVITSVMPLGGRGFAAGTPVSIGQVELAGCRLGDAGRYRWAISADDAELTLQSEGDACPSREAVFARTWTRSAQLTASPTPSGASSPAPTPVGTPILRTDGSGIIQTYAGAFMPTGDLAQGSDPQTGPVPESLVTLADGRVLGIGNSWPNQVPQMIWDPATGEFSKIGLLAGKRQQPTGVLLADGRVLIMGGDITDPVYGDGGYSGHVAAPTAELFDPTTGAFTAIGSMRTSRWAFPAVRLANGRVLIAGGMVIADSGDPVADAELFDPATNRFTATGPLNAPRVGHALVPLADGRVLVVGGVTTGRAPVLSTEIYDPGTGRFSLASAMPAVAAHPTGGTWWPTLPATAVALTDGRVLVPGLGCLEEHSILDDGHSEGYPPTPASIYDPVSETWTRTAPMPHCVSTATSLPNGQVLVTGWWNDGTPNPGTGIHLAPEPERDWSGLVDPVSGETRITGAPPAGRYMQLAPLADGRVLFVAGAAAEVFQ